MSQFVKVGRHWINLDRIERVFEATLNDKSVAHIVFPSGRQCDLSLEEYAILCEHLQKLNEVAQKEK